MAHAIPVPPSASVLLTNMLSFRISEKQSSSTTAQQASQESNTRLVSSIVQFSSLFPPGKLIETFPSEIRQFVPYLESSLLLLRLLLEAWKLHGVRENLHTINLGFCRLMTLFSI